jgi:HD superfamily phosphodiesterase
MPPSDSELVRALVHDANRYLSTDSPSNVRRESDLNHVKEVLGMAEKLLAGEATDEDRALVGDLVDPQVRSVLLPDS